MPDYKEMYLTIFKASEEALDILLEAQRKCEKMYLAGGGTAEKEDRLTSGPASSSSAPSAPPSE